MNPWRGPGKYPAPTQIPGGRTMNILEDLTARDWKISVTAALLAGLAELMLSVWMHQVMHLWKP